MHPRIRVPYLLLVVLILHLQVPAVAHAEDTALAALRTEINKQDAIFHRSDARQSDGYVTDRSLLSYVHSLSPAFDAALAALGPDQRWLDIGAGRGQAVLDYYAPRYDLMHGGARNGKARAVAISIEDRRSTAWQQRADALDDGRIRYYAGRRLREYARGELGRFDLITDVAGGFSYTPDLALFMQNVLDLLALNGRFFTLLIDGRSETAGARPYFDAAHFLTDIRTSGGAALPVCSWLKSIRCAEVVCTSKAGWEPPVQTFELRKTCEAVQVPPLGILHFEAGTPPTRLFQSLN